MNNTSIKIILLLPHIDGNRTSLARFDSFIDILVKTYNDVVIVNFSFPSSGNKFLGISKSSTHQASIAEKYNSNIITVKPNLNLIQKVFFALASKIHRRNIKPFLWLHQIVYQTDIFTPTIDDNFYNLIGLESKKYDNGIVIAFGGPFGIFTIADNISEKLKFKLVLDYRDPWNFGYPPVDGSKFIHHFKRYFKKNTELKYLEKSAKIFTVSNSLKSYFPIQFRSKIIVLENGSNFIINENDIIDVPNNFNIVYAGTIYKSQLKDESFFIALKKFVEYVKANTVKIYFLGSAKCEKLYHVLNKYNLRSIATVTDRLSNSELYAYFTNASLFLHLKYGSNTGIITSKHADYIAFKKNILLPISDDGDLKYSIEENKIGKVCNNSEEIYTYLIGLYQQQQNGISMKVNQSLQLNNHRYNISLEFLKHINSIVNKKQIIN